MTSGVYLQRLVIVCFLAVPLLKRVRCAPSLTLTTEPFSMGLTSFCPRPVNITCTGYEISTTFLWKNGSVEVVEYNYRSEHEDSFPRPVSLEVPLQGVTAEVTRLTRATLSSTTIDIVSTLFVANVSVLNGYSISCEDNLGRRSEELNIRVQPQDIPPSSSGASCSVLSSTGGLIVTLELDPSFIVDYAVDSYVVTVDPATSSCFNDQLSPNDRYSCTGLIVGTSYTFSISAVNCVDQIGATHTITVHPQSPQINDYIKVKALYICNNYCNSADIAEIIVQWEEMNQPMIAEGCSFNERLNFTVALKDNGAIIEQKFISSDSCVNGLCEIPFVFTSSRSYTVSVTATNGIRLTSGTVESSIIDGSVHFFTYTLTLIEGTIIALCIPLVESAIDDSNNCSIQYTKDSSFRNLSSPVIGPFNIPFAIPIKETTLYAQATVIVNTSIIISVRSSNVFEFTNGNESENRECTSTANTPFSTPMPVPINPGTVTFEVYQVVMLFLFLGILLLALIISIGIIICLVHKLKKKSCDLAETYDTISMSSRKAVQPSSYHEVQLAPNPNPTTTTTTTTGDIKRDVLSVVYDEIPVFMTNHSITAASKSEISLKSNSAYQSSSQSVIN